MRASGSRFWRWHCLNVTHVIDTCVWPGRTMVSLIAASWIHWHFSHSSFERAIHIRHSRIVRTHWSRRRRSPRGMIRSAGWCRSCSSSFERGRRWPSCMWRLSNIGRQMRWAGWWHTGFNFIFVISFRLLCIELQGFKHSLRVFSSIFCCDFRSFQQSIPLSR